MASKKKWLSVAAATASAALVLGGCASTESESGAGASAGSSDGSGQKVLQFWAFGDMGLGDFIAEYEAANPDIKIEMKVGDFDPHHRGDVGNQNQTSPESIATNS